MKIEGTGAAHLAGELPTDVDGDHRPVAVGEPVAAAPEGFSSAATGLPVSAAPSASVADVPAAAALLAAKGLGAFTTPRLATYPPQGIAGGTGGSAEPQATSTRPRSRAVPLRAIGMIVGAVTCFSLLDTTAKMLVTSDAPFGALAGAGAIASLFVVWARFAVHSTLYGVASGVVHHRPVLRVRSWTMQLVRSGCLMGATVFNFIALNYLQLAETVAIFFVAPLVVTALAGPMLGEWVGWRRWLAIVGGFAGVLVMARPGTSLFQPALVFSILSMLSYSFYVLLTRMLSSRESPESLVFVSAAVPAILLAAVLPWNWTPPETVAQWALVGTLGVYGLLGHFLFVRAYTAASTGALAPYTYIQIPIMVGLGWLVFGDLPDGPTFAGIAIIALAGLYVLARERQLLKQEREEERAAARQGVGG